MRRSLFGIFAILGAALFSGAPALAEARSVVFVNPGKRGEAFWESVAKAMEAAARQLDFQLEVLWAERNKLTMRQLGVEVAGRGADKPDFLVLVNEENAAAPALAAAEQAGLPTIFLSNPISWEDLAEIERTQGPIRHLLGSLEPDMRGAGRRMAERLFAAAEQANLRDADGKLHILALAGDEITPASIQRTQGLLEYAATRPDVKIDRLLYANWNQAEAKTLARRYLDLMRAGGLRPAGIWAANDPIAIGALEALREGGFSPGENAFAVGLNWSPEALALIEAGDLEMSDGGHFLAGGWTLVLLRDLVDGCRFLEPGAPRRALFETSAIDKSVQPELREMIRSGEPERIDFTKFLTASKVCGDYDFSREALVGALRSELP